jgi:hypothetical protein
VTRKELFDGPACSGPALSIVRAENGQIFFTPNGMAPASLPLLFPELAEANPQLSALSPRPSLQNLLDCIMNFLAPSLDHWPQKCVNLLYARKIA